MTAFRVLLASMLMIVLAYTGVVIATHGLGLLPVFFSDIQAMNWPGQFNLDFSCLQAPRCWALTTTPASVICRLRVSCRFEGTTNPAPVARAQWPRKIGPCLITTSPP